MMAQQEQWHLKNTDSVGDNRLYQCMEYMEYLELSNGINTMLLFIVYYEWKHKICTYLLPLQIDMINDNIHEIMLFCSVRLYDIQFVKCIYCLLGDIVFIL